MPELIENEAELIHAEEKIQLAMHRGFYDVGIELRHIRDRTLYLKRKGGLYKTFEEYCEKRWDLKIHRADELIRAAQVCNGLKNVSKDTFLPDRETHVRPLLKLDDKYRAEVWKRVIDSTNGIGITAKLVEGEVARKLAELNKNWFTVAEWKQLKDEEKKKVLTQFRQSKSKFNEQDIKEDSDGIDLTRIEWAQFSWNPITGCLHGCEYCYANEIANRFYPQKFEPSFYPDRLQAPFNTPLPDSGRGVFVCSMADLFGKWVPSEWIDAVLEQVQKADKWTFIFLTKNPKRYLDFKFPKNSWIGTTIDCKKRIKTAIETFEQIDGVIKFISFEPLSESILFDEEQDEHDHTVIHSGLDNFDWIIIGGRSRAAMAEMQPEWDWVESLIIQARNAGCKIYFKPNLTVRPKEYPK